MAWNEFGEIPNGREGAPQRYEHDTDLENGGHSSDDAVPQYLSRSIIRGRVPRMDSSDSDLDGADDLAGYTNEETMPATQLRFGARPSRRPGGSRT